MRALQSVDYLVEIAGTDPLTVHFSFYNPWDEPVYVPRLLTPLGAFVRLRITDADERVVYETLVPKLKPKLHPSDPESYHALEPGYTYGAVFTLEDEAANLASGDYRLHVTYTNLLWQGFEGHHLGEMTFETTITFHKG